MGFLWSLFYGIFKQKMLTGALILKLRGENHLTDKSTNLKAYHVPDFVLGTGDS